MAKVQGFVLGQNMFWCWHNLHTKTSKGCCLALPAMRIAHVAQCCLTVPMSCLRCHVNSSQIGLSVRLCLQRILMDVEVDHSFHTSFSQVLEMQQHVSRLYVTLMSLMCGSHAAHLQHWLLLWLQVLEKLRQEQKEVIARFGPDMTPKAVRAMNYASAVSQVCELHVRIV
jgi:hypothetical protein